MKSERSRWWRWCVSVSLVLACSAVASGPEQRDIRTHEITFSVSKVGKDKTKLLRLWEQINLDRLPPTVDMERRRFKMLSRISPRSYLAIDRGGKVVRIDYAEAKNIADDEDMELAAISETEDLYDYESVLGAKKSVRILKEFSDAQLKAMMLTQDEFTKRLRDGERFETVIYARCQTCKGQGKVTATKRQRGDQGKAACPKCRGRGEEPTEYIVKW